MVTTIQINEKTLMLLKKLKDELQAKSYEEAIERVVIEKSVQKAKNKSMAGSLKKYFKKGETVKNILREMQNERRKSDRF